jgi:hypothetical protein
MKNKADGERDFRLVYQSSSISLGVAPPGHRHPSTPFELQSCQFAALIAGYYARASI